MGFHILTAAIYLLMSAASAQSRSCRDVRGPDASHRPLRGSPQASALDDREFLIDTCGTQEEWHPAIASDGTNCLVVWSDARSGDYDVYGARVSPQGDILDPAGIVIGRAASDQQYPVPAFDGTNYLVVWQDTRNGSIDIYGARLTPAGTVLDTAGVAVSTANFDQRYPALAFDGNSYLAVWQDSRTGLNYDIYCARVSPEGTVHDDSGLKVSAAASDQVHPTIASDGTNCLVVWQDFRSPPYRIYGSRVTPSGAVLDTAGVAISNRSADHEHPAATFDGANYLIVWGDTRNSPGENDIYGARVTPDATVLDTGGIAISTSSSAQYDVKLAFDGTEYFVVWADDRGGDDDIYSARVTPPGTVYAEGLVVSQTYGQTKPSVCLAGASMMLVYRGWAGVVGSKTYNTQRIWGKMNPNAAAKEDGAAPGTKGIRNASIGRGMLRLPDGSDPGWLLDISGRKVACLSPGPNDISHLAPGVYFEQNSARLARISLIK